MALSTSQLSAYTRLFSSAVFRELATKRKSPLFMRLAIESGVLGRSAVLRCVGDVFEAAFAVLKKGGLRDEYMYKAALTHRVLLGKHNLKTACMLTEFRAGACKADIAILNGTTTVFEIKSERDSLSRLERQIENYRRVFASIIVIAGENHVGSVLKATSREVGVMSLSSRYQIKTEREAIDQPERICPISVFEAIRASEAKEILVSLNRMVPRVPNTEMHAALRREFERLPPAEVHAAMLTTLKHSRSLLPLATLVDKLPRSLQPAALTVPLRRADHERLVAAMTIPIEQAMGWA